MRLTHLAYVSRATDPVGANELARISAQAAANNPGLGVTGLLMHSSGRFIQLLEGPPGAVGELYDRIEADPRHTDVQCVLYKPTTDRLFADWSMGVIDLDEHRERFDASELWEMLNTTQEMSPDARAEHLYTLLSSFNAFIG